MTLTRHATLLAMTLVGLTGLLNAQTSIQVKAKVPFAFVAQGTTMSAGECTVRVVMNGQTRLSISSEKQHVYAFPIADESPNAGKKTVFVFHQYGDRYFLTGIQRENGIGYQLPASRLERELQARNIPGHGFTLLASAN